MKKLRLSVLALAVTLVGGILGWTGTFAEARKVPIYSVERPDNKIAISFDAAWGNEHTAAILRILEEYNVKTTFFLVKFWAEKFPDDVQKIAAAGHEVESHSATHPDMAKLSPQQIRQELETTGKVIEDLTGRQPHLFRPPFGSYNNGLMETAEACGYQVIQWSRDGLATKENVAIAMALGPIGERGLRLVKQPEICYTETGFFSKKNGFCTCRTQIKRELSTITLLL